jgi:hypothetical protein
MVIAVGCGDDGNGNGGSGGTAGMGGTGGVGGTDTVTLTVTTTEVQGLVPIGPALEGVMLCQTDTTNCATTDADGMASIVLPADQEVSYTLEKEGYAPYLVADATDETLFQTGPWAMYSDQRIADLFEALGIDSPMGGQVILRAVSGSIIDGIAGVTFDLVDETATPFYNEQDWTPTFDLTATTSIGQGGFVEQATGEYQVEYAGTATNCSVQIGWTGDAANRVKLPVRAGYLSFGTMVCDEP